MRAAIPEWKPLTTEYSIHRHLFATDMLSGGVSLPALMQLMGHAKIQTTLEYVQISSQDVFQQYARAVAQQIRRIPAVQS